MPGTSRTSPATTSGTVHGESALIPPTSAAAPSAVWIGQRIEEGAAGAGSVVSRPRPASPGNTRAAAIPIRGSSAKNAQRHPTVLAIRAPNDGPISPGSTQAAASSASTRGRSSSG